MQSSKLIQLTGEQGGEGMCRKHKEAKLLKPVLLQRQGTRSCRLSSSCQPRYQMQGLGRTFIWVAAPRPTDWGKTGNRNMEGNEDWSFKRYFFAMSVIYATPHHQLLPALCLREEEPFIGDVLLLTKPGLPVQLPVWLLGHLHWHRKAAGGGKRRRAAAYWIRHCPKETITKQCHLYCLVQKVLFNREVFLSQYKR